MSRRVVEVDGRLVGFIPDDPAPVGDQTWLLARARLVDELTWGPPSGLASARLVPPVLAIRVAEGGLVGLVGRPRRAFPRLGQQPATLDLELSVPGYLPRIVQVRLPVMAGFPAAFSPVDLGDRVLHRRPVVLRGRVMRRMPDGRLEPTTATVQITRIERRPSAPPAAPPVPLPPRLAALRPPLQLPRRATTGRLRAVSMQPVAPDRRLTADAPPVARWLVLSDLAGLPGPGSRVLLVGADDPDRREYIAVASLLGPGPVGQSARVVLAHPTVFAHHIGAAVRVLAPQPAPGGPWPLREDALPGDTTVLLTAVQALSAGLVRVTGGAVPDEYRELERYRQTVTTAADGYFRLPPLSRVVAVRLRASRTQAAFAEHDLAPDYAAGEHRIDFITP